MDGFFEIVPELIKSSGDDPYLYLEPPGNDVFNLLLVTQKDCAACARLQQTLREMQQDINLDFSAVIYYMYTFPRRPDDVNHLLAMASLKIKNAPALYLINKRKRLIPFPMLKMDGTQAPHLVNLTKMDIYNIWRN